MLKRFAVLVGFGVAMARAQVPDNAGLDQEPVDRSTPVPVRLAYWQFNTARLTNDAGGGPTLNTAARVESQAGNGVAFRGRSHELCYPWTWSAAGTARTNFNFSNGTIRFTYVPDWYTGNPNDKPNEWCRLIECGAWALSIDPQGRHVVFQSPTLNGSVQTNVIADLPPKPTGSDVTVAWEIALSYTPTRSWLQINESFAGYSNTGVEAIPGAVTRTRGVRIGSGLKGTFPAQGSITELESFNGATDTKIFSDGIFPRVWDPKSRRAQIMTASDTSSGLRLSWLRGWEGDGKTNSGLYGISRRMAGTLDWSTVASQVRGQTWTDTNAVPGAYYEYRIGRNPSLPIGEFPSIVAARRGSPIDARGRAILLIDTTISTALAREIAALKRDLVSEGWSVLATNVPRHVDLDYPYPNEANYTQRAIPVNSANALRIKSYLKSIYDSDPGQTNVVFLIGHVTIPYSGFETIVDGHAEHNGAFPADSWYGDMTGTWTDRLSKPSANIINRNIAGDGRWDQEVLPPEADGSPGRLEMGVGRIDFGLMEAWGDKAAGESMSATELRLLRTYFRKTRRWRRAEIVVKDDFRAWITTDARFAQLIPSAQRLQSHLWGTETYDPGRYLQDLFKAPETVLWGIHADFGAFNSIGLAGGPNYHHVAEMGKAGWVSPPRGMFTLYFGSYFGEWFHWTDDLMRSLTGSPDTVLTATWVNVWQGTVWRADRFHMGAPYATALQDTFAANPGTSCRTTAILGDPFLREYPLAPVISLSATAKKGRVVLSWPVQDAATDGYRIFRAESTNSPSWTWLADVAPGTSTWTHRAAKSSVNAYMIQSMSLKTTGSGSYTNTSIGTFAPGLIKF